MRAEEFLDSLLELSPAILYAALYGGSGEPVFRKRQSATMLAADREYWDELLVNPTLLDLLRRRGNLDGGAVEHVVVRFTDFAQLLLPLEHGHVTVCLEPAVDPMPLVGTIYGLAEHHGARRPKR